MANGGARGAGVVQRNELCGDRATGSWAGRARRSAATRERRSEQFRFTAGGGKRNKPPEWERQVCRARKRGSRTRPKSENDKFAAGGWSVRENFLSGGEDGDVSRWPVCLGGWRWAWLES